MYLIARCRPLLACCLCGFLLKRIKENAIPLPRPPGEVSPSLDGDGEGLLETNASPEFALRTRGIRAQRELPCLWYEILPCAGGGTGRHLMAAYFRKRKWRPVRVTLAIQSIVLDPQKRLRLRSARRQLGNTASSSRPDYLKPKSFVKTSAFDYRTRLAVSGSRSASSRTGRQLSSAMPVSLSARRKMRLSLHVQLTRVSNPAEPR